MKEEIENALRMIWMLNEDGKDVEERQIEEKVLKEMIDSDLVLLSQGKVNLTERGKKEAEKIVRLHRLAERLLTDILGIREGVEEHACRFEHVIDDEAEEAICTLLGHPEICPHGRKIPPGSCCLKNEREVERVIFRLSELSPGDEAEIKYIVADEEESKILLSAGIIPGVKIKVLRVYPAFVIQIDNTQFAIDKRLADCINVIKKV